MRHSLGPKLASYKKYYLPGLLMWVCKQVKENPILHSN
jgi:hypothetical protein